MGPCLPQQGVLNQVYKNCVAKLSEMTIAVYHMYLQKCSAWYSLGYATEEIYFIMNLQLVTNPMYHAKQTVVWMLPNCILQQETDIKCVWHEVSYKCNVCELRPQEFIWYNHWSPKGSPKAGDSYIHFNDPCDNGCENVVCKLATMLSWPQSVKLCYATPNHTAQKAISI